jgi:FkbM family methyltransferase
VTFFQEIVLFVLPKCFLEIGAFRAEFSIGIKQKLPGTRVIAFEANPDVFAHMNKERDYKSLGVGYRNSAVAAKTGSVDFWTQAMPDGSVRPDVAGDNSILSRNSDGVSYQALSVRTVALADLMCTNEFISYDYCLWIDVEGACREVLSGSERALEREGAVLIEVEDHAYWAGQWLSTDVIRFFLAQGFYPVARDYEYAHQYKIVFVHRRFLTHPKYATQYTLYAGRCAKRG